ncbi:DUF294 nucleotidyltransferase-like domain-containing protein [Raineyella fluvialis]|uniref:CBS domain-containing protein n=1 Tax=Raineyella fluvialis TaxID=2662261 RepID=A0A5Q2F7F2_9ACTN|nr:DUF294 nucleotidyltransferase-like domain-containing protein [Raineyella fluvialis]QGF22401.1 CBS domain-containing protein [Raineyella fluvialis]
MNVELTGIRDFLAAHHPFDLLPPEELDSLPARLTGRYFRRGTVILPAGRPTEAVYILRSGAVDITDANGALADRCGEGGAFGVSAARDDGPSRFTMTALEDSLALLMTPEDFRRLLASYRDFARFFDEQSAERLQAAVEALRLPEAGHEVLRTTLRDIVSRAPVSVDENLTVRDAARLMTANRVSALLVTRPGGESGDALSGIVTDRDMRRLIVGEGLPAEGPVSSIMTADPITIDPDAPAVEAMLMMMQRGFHHLPVVEHGRPVGMVTSGDIMRLQQANPVAIVGAIAACDDLDSLIVARGRLPGVVRELVRQDASAAEIGRIVTAVGDAVTRTLLRLAEADLGPAPVPYAWVALGSQGRLELGLSSDQDNALVLPDPPDPAADPDPAVDEWFAALAERVTAGLAACGYPLCPGDIMATNPAWRLSRSQWFQVFTRWISEPDSDAVLHADTFFDMRAITGADLVEPLLDAVHRGTADNQRFLARLAREAVSWVPPIGFFRGFVLDRAGQGTKGLDLKAGGIAPIVQIARVHALAAGLPEVNTAARLSAAAATGGISQRRADDLRGAYELISHLRHQHHSEQAERGEPADNVIDPGSLSTIDQHSLRDAFRIIKEAQQELAFTYQLHAVS